ncbi:unnamed protein product [Rhizophagus irregularis]|nr:unnamed protein product [Rhizophagus irregularis]
MSKESTPAHFDNITAEPDIPIALTSGTTAMSEMEPSVKRAIDHDEDPDKFMIITEKDIDLAREYRNRMMSDAGIIAFAKKMIWVYVYGDDEWKEALIYSCETSHLWLQVGHEVAEGRIELFLHDHNLNAEMLSGDLLAERVKRVQARQRLRNGFNFSNERVTAKVSLYLIPLQLSKRQNRKEDQTLVESASSASSASSHLSRDLRRLNTSEKITSATLDPETTRLANEEQKGKRLLRENEGINYPDHFAPESVKERLDGLA